MKHHIFNITVGKVTSEAEVTETALSTICSEYHAVPPSLASLLPSVPAAGHPRGQPSKRPPKFLQRGSSPLGDTKVSGPPDILPVFWH